MSEENTIENQAPIDPELSESLELEDGELSEEELDAQSGGSALPMFSADPLLTGDVKVRASIDSSYASYHGATGSNQNEGQAAGLQPMNMTVHFP